MVKKPDYNDLKKLCPDIPEDLLRAHLERLDENYYGVFSLERVKDHLHCLARLAPDHPVEVLFEEGAGGETACTVMAYDYPSEFSLITGVLSSTGFNILSGNIFTYAHVTQAPKTRGQKRMIIDRFCGVVQSDQSIEQWKSAFKTSLEGVIALLEKDTETSLAAARSAVNEMVASRLAGLKLPAESVLYPVGITVTNSGNYTRLSLLSQDTPAFLYAMSSALAFQGLSIEQVRIGTVEGRVQDEIDILDERGSKITESSRIDTIKISVLLTKQFTYFLWSSPDPYAALCRFENMLASVLSIPERGKWIELLSTPEALHGLAKLLGASDYVWEDFIRLQYEALLPILKPSGEAHPFAVAPEDFESKLRAELSKVKGFEEECRVLNEFKDRELYLVDLEQILGENIDVKKFSQTLTRLAETTVRLAAGIVFRELVVKYGVPRTVAGLEAQWAIFGLGKFGGEALGYASDIELLLVFSDNGRTDGKESIENSEYFSKAALMLTEIIRAKREGIFHVDIRLRPYGESGPMACSLDSFCRYYGPKGKAHSYERLALVRLRAVAGNSEFGGKIERLRDEFIYGASSIKLTELRELREKQFADKVSGGRYNAKFSPGALVDLEYDVQLLQVMHGAENTQLRTSSIHEALAALSDLGVLSPDEGKRLAAAYYFFRRLINGLRMLRGSARDLFLPPEDSIEFVHLARRMGYRREELEPQQQLRVEFETRTAAVRAFVERHFGRDSLPGKPAGNVADLVLSDSIPPPLREKILSAAGFINPERAYVNLRALGGAPERQDLFAPLAVLVCDTLRQSVDPDRALNNWERYVRTAGNAVDHYALLMAQPRRLEILLGILAASQFLAETLIRNPEFFNWATAPETLNRVRPLAEMEKDLGEFVKGLSRKEWPNAIRKFRCREILRIGTRDIYLHAPIREITADLSSLAVALVRAALAHFLVEPGLKEQEAAALEGLCILAFGKLGGGELNYSSDIDLLGVYDAGPADSDLFYRAMKQVGKYLSGHTEEGHAYRVDFRLRPYGRAGQVAYSLPALADYYRNKAATWEVQALLKASPVAGSDEVGRGFADMVKKIMVERKDPAEIISSIKKMRDKHARTAIESGMVDPDIKEGLGGIRDIEFLAQGLQLVNCSSIPELISGNTLEALALLGRHNLLPAATVEQLKSDYEFLRRVEHCMQIFEDRQIHILPESDTEREALARRVLGVKAGADDFLKDIAACQARTRNSFKTCLDG
jgi:glutamate-ammonia-ligase adenylyltransferase